MYTSHKRVKKGETKQAGTRIDKKRAYELTRVNVSKTEKDMEIVKRRKFGWRLENPTLTKVSRLNSNIYIKDILENWGNRVEGVLHFSKSRKLNVQGFVLIRLRGGEVEGRIITDTSPYLCIPHRDDIQLYPQGFVMNFENGKIPLEEQENYKIGQLEQLLYYTN